MAYIGDAVHNPQYYHGGSQMATNRLPRYIRIYKTEQLSYEKLHKTWFEQNHDVRVREPESYIMTCGHISWHIVTISHI